MYIYEKVIIYNLFTIYIQRSEATSFPSFIARYSALSLTRMWNSCWEMITNEICIASTSTVIAEQRIYCEDDSKIKDCDDLVQCFLISSEVQPNNCGQSSLRERSGNRCVRWMRLYLWPWYAKMAVAPGKNKLKMGSAGRYYGAYLIYDVANSCLAALHAKMPPPVVVTRTNPPSPVHVQNPRKFSSSFLYFSVCVTGASVTRWRLQMFDSLDFLRAFSN